MREWDWKEHFSPQPDTLEYLNYVADKFDLRRDIGMATRAGEEDCHLMRSSTDVGARSNPHPYRRGPQPGAKARAAHGPASKLKDLQKAEARQ